MQAHRDKADLALQSRLAELEKMTDVLKIEMNKADLARRVTLANAVSSYANAQAVHAKSVCSSKYIYYNILCTL